MAAKKTSSKPKAVKPAAPTPTDPTVCIATEDGSNNCCCEKCNGERHP